LKQSRLVRQISAIFNTGALGYRSSLVAMAVPESDLDRAAAAVNRYPGVSHNYLRPGEYNMWFTIAVPPGKSLEEGVDDLSKAAGGWPALILPALRKYKLEVVLDVLEEGEGDTVEEKHSAARTESSGSFQPTERNIQVVRCIQEDLPLTERPFKDWASGLGMEESELLNLISSWLNQGIIRRFAAVLNHRKAGFSANGMVVWNAPQERIDECGHTLASHAEVSHCYHRPGYRAWPYNLYAMIHGRSVEECESTAERLGKAIHLQDYKILFSTREFKKIRLKLFWPQNSEA
jgi:DNA-binding Lrp family transcriptional regulator